MRSYRQRLSPLTVFLHLEGGVTVGRKAKYNSAEEIQEKVDAYFASCEGYIFRDDEGKLVFDKYGRPVIMDAHPPTITGLALALGFASRNGLLKYQAKKEFADVITLAKSRVEKYMEERLFDRDGANGAKWALAANFGWNGDRGGESAGPVVKIICDIPRPDAGSADAQEKPADGVAPSGGDTNGGGS